MRLHTYIDNNRHIVPTEEHELILRRNRADDFLREAHYTNDEILRQHNTTQRVVNLLAIDHVKHSD